MSELLTGLVLATENHPLCSATALGALSAIVWLARQLVKERRRNELLVDQLLELALHSASLAEGAAERLIRQAAKQVLKHKHRPRLKPPNYDEGEGDYESEDEDG